MEKGKILWKELMINKELSLEFDCHLKSLNSNVRSLISMPESLIAAIVLGSSSRAVSASFEKDVAAFPIACQAGRKK